MAPFPGLLSSGLAALGAVVKASPQFGRPLGLPNFSGLGKSAGSPTYNYIFQKELPIPQVAQPMFTENIDGRTIQYYETTVESFQQQVYPDLGPANLVGYSKSSKLGIHQAMLM